MTIKMKLQTPGGKGPVPLEYEGGGRPNHVREWTDAADELVEDGFSSSDLQDGTLNVQALNEGNR